MAFSVFSSAWRRFRNRTSRAEWYIRRLKLPVSKGTAEEPGLLLVQIDGLARAQFERALQSGRMPFLRRLLRRQGYGMHTFYSGLPASTPAVQAELHYGRPCAVPAFGFVDRESQRVATMYTPEWAKKIEAGLREEAEGLLAGGSSWSNIYTGGAKQSESHFCAASLGLGDLKRTVKLAAIFWFMLLEPLIVLRIAGLLVAELFLGLWDAARGILRGESWKNELLFLFPRIFVCVGLREVITAGAATDLARGLPIVHINFLGYDEQSHRRGPGSSFAHWSLRGIDRSVRRLYHAARVSGRRDYQVWVFSDHGQEDSRSFVREFDGGVEAVLREQLGGMKKPIRPRSQRAHSAANLAGGPGAGRRRRDRERGEALTEDERETFSVAAMGPVGHVYLAKPFETDAEKRELAERLVARGKVPGVLYRTGSGAVEWRHPGGLADSREQFAALLPHPPALAFVVAGDLIRLCENARAGDLVLLGWMAPRAGSWTFPHERGSHAGPGLQETQGFALLPARTRLPPGCETFIRPAALRAAARHFLGREAIERAPSPAAARRGVDRRLRLRVATYNVHSCLGMDGKTAPRRVARVIERLEADIVALQEIDLGRARSGGHDQADLLARELGCHAVFCPTVIIGGERYGHALLSRWPIEVMRNTTFADEDRIGRFRAWREPRGALWVRLQPDEEGPPLHVISAHLGLSSRERREQVAQLLGPDWFGAIPPGEPAIVGGDFNLFPDAAPYRDLLAAKLRDVQRLLPGRRPLKTFSTWYPLSRIDHLFVTEHFDVESVEVPSDDLTRVASDHYPLVAELALRERPLSPAAASSASRAPRSRS